VSAKSTFFPFPLIALLALFAFALGGCGSDETELHVPEGEPVEIGGVSYNVVTTRYLNPDSVDDRTYLKGHDDWPAADKLYLGVFLQVHNNSGETITVPSDLTVVDTRDRRFKPIALDNDFALDFSEEVTPGHRLPAVDSAPYYGPIEGSLVLFEIGTESVDSRPLTLQIPARQGDGMAEIELDI